jgi:hypothetical protein
MATYYWVGNSGSADDPAHWALTSGGAGGAGVPVDGDIIIVDFHSITITGQTITFPLALSPNRFYIEGNPAGGVIPNFNIVLANPMTIGPTGIFDTQMVVSGPFTSVNVTGKFISHSNYALNDPWHIMNWDIIEFQGNAEFYSINANSIIFNTLDLASAVFNIETTFGDPIPFISTNLFSVISSLASLAVLQPNTGTASFTVNIPSGIVDLSYTTFNNCAVTGGVTFNAYTSNGCQDRGGNSGINFAPPKVLTSIQISPGQANIDKGGTQQFTVIGTYDDSSQEDITSQCDFSSDHEDVATVDDSGLATAVNGGFTTITADIGDFSAAAMLEVIFTQIKVLPSTKYLTPGEAWQYSAIIGEEDYTNQVIWVSSDPSVAAVSSSGLVKTFKLGRVAITATLDGVTGGAILIVVPNITTGIPNIVSFANRYGVYRSAALQSKRYKYPKQTFSVIKVIATTYPVTIDIIYPLLKRGPKTISAKVSSSDPQRIKPLLADCCEVRAYNSNAVISAIYLATSMSEIPL